VVGINIAFHLQANLIKIFREVKNLKRRSFLKLLGGVGALSFTGLTIGCDKKDSVDADAPDQFPKLSKLSGQKPEAVVDVKTGKVQVDGSILMRHSACLGCYSSCGNRVKIDKNTGKILRVYGNPYNPNNAEPHLSFEEPLAESYLAFSGYKDKGSINRGTLCGRGNATLESHYDPMRTLVPLKRTSGRGEGKWMPITWEEAVEETVEGGELFKDAGESTYVEGFRQVRDLDTLIDEKAPELGSKANQLVFFGGRGDGRTSFGNRFINAFGTLNSYSHGYS